MQYFHASCSWDMRPVYWVVGIIWLVFAFIIVMVHYSQRRLNERTNGALGQSPTLAMYNVMYAFLSLIGLGYGVNGIYMIVINHEEFRSQTEGPLLVVFGLIINLPLWVVYIYGRSAVYEFVANNFDRDNAEQGADSNITSTRSRPRPRPCPRPRSCPRSRSSPPPHSHAPTHVPRLRPRPCSPGNGPTPRPDGAFIAAILDQSMEIEKGDTWWIHKDESDESLPMDNPNRNFNRGIVTEIEDKRFAVMLNNSRERTGSSSELEPAGGGDSRENSGRSGRSIHRMSERLGLFKLGAGTGSFAPSAAVSPVANLRKQMSMPNGPRKISVGSVDEEQGSVADRVDVLPVIWVPRSGRLTSEELLTFARENLRCVDWHSITLDLLRSSHVKDGEMNLSRPVAKDQTIGKWGQG